MDFVVFDGFKVFKMRLCIRMNLDHVFGVKEISSQNVEEQFLVETEDSASFYDIFDSENEPRKI